MGLMERWDAEASAKALGISLESELIARQNDLLKAASKPTSASPSGGTTIVDVSKLSKKERKEFLRQARNDRFVGLILFAGLLSLFMWVAIL